MKKLLQKSSDTSFYVEVTVNKDEFTVFEESLRDISNLFKELFTLINQIYGFSSEDESVVIDSKVLEISAKMKKKIDPNSKAQNVVCNISIENIENFSAKMIQFLTDEVGNKIKLNKDFREILSKRLISILEDERQIMNSRMKKFLSNLKSYKPTLDKRNESTSKSEEDLNYGEYIIKKEDEFKNIVKDILTASSNYHRKMMEKSEKRLKEFQNSEKLKSKNLGIPVKACYKSNTEVDKNKMSEDAALNSKNHVSIINEFKTLQKSSAKVIPPPRVKSSSKNTLVGIKYIALYNLQTDNEEDLSFKIGDIIEKLEDVDENWALGKTIKNQVGVYPKNYTKQLE